MSAQNNHTETETESETIIISSSEYDSAFCCVRKESWRYPDKNYSQCSDDDCADLQTEIESLTKTQ